MLDTPTVRGIRDFSQRYNHTFGWLIQENKKNLVYISEIKDTQVSFQTTDETVWYANCDANVMFEFIPVVRGFKPTTKGIFFLHRIPARQWQRGISTSNTGIFKLTTGWVSIPLNLESMGDVFEKTISYEESLGKFFKNPKTSAALNQFFAFCNGYIYFNQSVIGKYDGTKIKLNPLCPVIQEFTDGLKRAEVIEKFTIED